MRSVRGTREWAVAEINCCTGCPYQCRYCYARAKAIAEKRVVDEDDWQHIRLYDHEGSSFSRYDGQVMFPAAHDIVPDNLERCVFVIDQLLKKQNRVLVVSKPSPEIIAHLCERFADRKEHVLFRFTITARDRALLEFWEPGAPDYEQRLSALKHAARLDFATSVSIEPMLDIDDIHGLIADLTPFVSHSIWIGLMNKIDQRVSISSKSVQEAVELIKAGQEEERIHALYEELKNNPLIRWKESIKNIVGLPEPPRPGMDI